MNDTEEWIQPLPPDPCTYCEKGYCTEACDRYTRWWSIMIDSNTTIIEEGNDDEQL